MRFGKSCHLPVNWLAAASVTATALLGCHEPTFNIRTRHRLSVIAKVLSDAREAELRRASRLMTVPQQISADLARRRTRLHADLLRLRRELTDRAQRWRRKQPQLGQPILTELAG